MSKKFLLIIILLILASTIVVAFFIMRSSERPAGKEKPQVSQKTNSESNSPETANSPSPQSVILFDEQSIFTTFDSNLQIVYPSLWQQSNGTSPVLGLQSDILQSVDFSDTTGNIKASITVSEQYQVQLETILDCGENSGFICEPTLIANEKFVIRTSVTTNPKTISATSIKNRKIYQLTFTIFEGASQNENIELARNIISALRFF